MVNGPYQCASLLRGKCLDVHRPHRQQLCLELNDQTFSKNFSSLWKPLNIPISTQSNHETDLLFSYKFLCLSSRDMSSHLKHKRFTKYESTLTPVWNCRGLNFISVWIKGLLSNLVLPTSFENQRQNVIQQCGQF